MIYNFVRDLESDWRDFRDQFCFISSDECDTDGVDFTMYSRPRNLKIMK